MDDPTEKPVLRIDLHSSTPVYRQILDGLRILLVSGMFHPGDKLPTVREMAIDLGVNHNTVAEAYRLLADDGWLDLKRHHGATVLSRGPRARVLSGARILPSGSRNWRLWQSLTASTKRLSRNN